MSSRTTVLAGLVAVAMLAAPARADQAKAETYFRAGEQAYRAQSFVAAAEQFEQAYREDPVPAIAFSAAQAYRKQYAIEPKPEYVKRAVELYRIYLDAVKTGHRVGDAAAGLEDMKHELDRLMATSPSLKIGAVDLGRTRLAVSITIAGDRKTDISETASIPATDDVHATATLDGKPVELFAPIDVPEGEHTVAVDAPGYFPQTVKRRVVAGVTELVELQLQPRPAHLAVKAADGAEIAVNGRPIGTAPLPPHELPAGTYLVGITHRGREPVVEEVALARGEDRTVDVAMTKTWRRRAVPWLVISGGVLVAGSLATALVAAHYDSAMSSIEQRRVTVGISPADLTTYRNDASSRDDYRATAFALGGTAVACGAVAALFYLFDHPQVGEHAIVPTATASGGGAALVGTF